MNIRPVPGGCFFRPCSADLLPDGRERRSARQKVRRYVGLLRVVIRLLFGGGAAREVAGAGNGFRAGTLQLYWYRVKAAPILVDSEYRRNWLFF